MADMTLVANKLRSNKRKRIYYRLFVCLVAIVVFCTVYALILPAITQSSTYTVESVGEAATLTAEDGEEVDVIRWTVKMTTNEPAQYFVSSVGEGLSLVASQGIEMNATEENGEVSEFSVNLHGEGDSELDAPIYEDAENSFYFDLASASEDSRSLAEYSGKTFVSYTLVYYTYYEQYDASFVYQTESTLFDDDFSALGGALGEFSFGDAYGVDAAGELDSITEDGKEIDVIKWTVNMTADKPAQYYASTLGDNISLVTSKGIELTAADSSGEQSEYTVKIHGVGDGDLNASEYKDNENSFYIDLASSSEESKSLEEYSAKSFVSYTLVYYTYFNDNAESGVFKTKCQLLDNDFGELAGCTAKCDLTSDDAVALADDEETESSSTLSAENLDGQTFAIVNFSSVGNYALTSTGASKTNSGSEQSQKYLARTPVEIVSTDSDGITTITDVISDNYGYGFPVGAWTFEKVEGTTNHYYISTTTRINEDGTYETGKFYLYMGINTWQITANDKTPSSVYEFVVEEATGEYAGKFTIRTASSGISGYRYLTCSKSNNYFANEVENVVSDRRYMTLCKIEETSPLDGREFSIVSLNVYSTDEDVLATKINHALSSTEYPTENMTLEGSMKENPTSALKGTEIALDGTYWDKETGLKLGRVTAKEAGNRVTIWKFIHIPGTTNKYLIQDTETGKYLWLGNTVCSALDRPDSKSQAKVTDTITTNNIITLSIGDENSYTVASGTHEGQVILWSYQGLTADKYVALRWYGTYKNGKADYFTTGNIGAYNYGNLNAMTLCEIEHSEIDVSASFYGLTDEQIESILGTGTSDDYSIPISFKNATDETEETMTVSPADDEDDYEYHGNTSGTTYSWTYNSLTGESYIFSEEAYQLDDYIVSTRVTQTYYDSNGKLVTESAWAHSTEELANAVISGTTVSVSFENFYTKKDTGALSIIKTASSDGALLNGAVFTLTDTTDSTKVFTATSDDSGIAMFSDLPTGTYILTETTAPNGYNSTGTTWTVEVTVGTIEESQVISVNVYENDENGDPIKTTGNDQVYFKTITPKGEGDETEVKITQENFPITNDRDASTLVVEKTFTGLTAAQMEAIESASTTDYTGYKIRLTSDAANKDEQVDMQLSLSEAVKSGSAIGGYTYTWTLPSLVRQNPGDLTDITYTLTEYNYEHSSYADVLISGSLTDTDGNETEIDEDDIVLGTADDGSETATIATSLNNKTTISVTNDYTKTFSLHLYKKAKDSGALQSGVTFDVYGPYGQSTHIKETYTYVDEDGNTQTLYWIAQLTTDENGLAVLDDLLLTTFGGDVYTYALVEDTSTVPDGYTDADPVVFICETTSKDNPGTYYKGVYTLTVYDPKIYRSDTLTFLKVDADDADTVLSGAGFGLYKLTCTDSTHDHSADILEVDESGNLTNSEQKECWTLVTTDTSTSDGLIELYEEDLAETDDTVYRLVEFAAPDGYYISEGQWVVGWQNDKLVITDTVGTASSYVAQSDSKTSDDKTTVTYSYLVYNTPGYSLPQTGGKGTLGIKVAGGIITAITLCAMAYIKIKKYGRREKPS